MGDGLAGQPLVRKPLGREPMEQLPPRLEHVVRLAVVGQPLERILLDRRWMVMSRMPISNMRKSIATAACLLAGAGAGAPLAAVGGAGAATHAAASVFHLSSTDDKTSATKVDAKSLAEVSGARKQWKAGITGAGVDVAVIDSGVTPVDGLSAPGKVVYGPDFTLDSTDDTTRNLDVFGHGTHISGIIAGRDDEVT